VTLVVPMQLCPHGRSLLYRYPDGSTWCFCDLPTDPAHEHLNGQLAAQREQWEELGRLKEPGLG
jgi:hypothetical protein